MKRFLTLFLALSLIDVLMVSCFCDCPSPDEAPFVYCQIDTENLDNSGQEITIASDTVVKSAYGIRLAIETVLGDVCQATHSMPLLSGAYAVGCHCEVATYFYSTNPITRVEILTNAAFDANTPAGSDVADRFFRFNGESYTEAGQAIRNTQSLSYTGEHILELLLMEAPENAGEYQFNVEIELQDGTVYTSLTPVIYLR